MTEYERLEAQHKLLKDENLRREHKLLFEAIDNLTVEREQLRADVERLTLEKKAAAMNYEALLNDALHQRNDWMRQTEELEAEVERLTFRCSLFKQMRDNQVDFLRECKRISDEAQADVGRLKAQEPVAWMVEDSDKRHFIFRMVKPEIQEGELLTPLYLASGAAQEPDPQLCSFYQVTTFPELVAAMERHILKLQAKVPPRKDEFSRTHREG